MISFKLGGNTKKQETIEEKTQQVAALFQDVEDVEEDDDKNMIHKPVGPLAVNMIRDHLKTQNDSSTYISDSSSPRRNKSEENLDTDQEVNDGEQRDDINKEKLKTTGLVYKGGNTTGKSKSRYIDALAQRSLKREMELEIVKERQLKREREQGEKEKEVFVTGAYKKRLLERKEYEEKMMKKELQEALNDPTKKKDLTAFHSYMLEKGMSSRSRAGTNEQTKK